jgi:hypothetical protein
MHGILTTQTTRKDGEEKSDKAQLDLFRYDLFNDISKNI